MIDAPPGGEYVCMHRYGHRKRIRCELSQVPARSLDSGEDHVCFWRSRPLNVLLSKRSSECERKPDCSVAE